ncbi:MAG TPA: hypothetical protein VFC47_13265 [Caulobacteraceae bacterium]|nr:hypothetical protein [Caulobacteraceae bacterium]
MSAADCRAEAREAQTNALVSDPKMRLHWEATVREWMQLAVTAEAQARLERDLLDGNLS